MNYLKIRRYLRTHKNILNKQQISVKKIRETWSFYMQKILKKGGRTSMKHETKRLSVKMDEYDEEEGIFTG